MALVPSLGGLLTLLRAVGLEEAQVLEPPPGAYEQLARGRRVMISARSTPRSDRRPMCPSVGERPRPIDVLERLASPSGLCRWSVARSRAELEAARANAWVRAQVGLQEVVIPRGTAPGELFDLPGICPVELRAVRFRVDLESSSDGRKEAPLPNYRERMVCPSCGLNARQRALALVARSFAGTVPAGSPVLLLEQESALFRFLADLPDIGTRLVGSELLGPSYQSGEVVDGIRNEDACRLSFASASLAVHMSGDVLEHVNDPRRALAEAHRCLEPGGLLLFTVPFHHDRDRSRARATIDMQGRLRHLAPPVFHGDPMRPEGALVITDFGWDLLEWIRDAGFRDAAALAYWDPSFGFLHPLDFLFVGWK
jgi:SAM-dependent methyltransferase